MLYDRFFPKYRKIYKIIVHYLEQNFKFKILPIFAKISKNQRIFFIFRSKCESWPNFNKFLTDSEFVFIIELNLKFDRFLPKKFQKNFSCFGPKFENKADFTIFWNIPKIIFLFLKPHFKFYRVLPKFWKIWLQNFFDDKVQILNVTHRNGGRNFFMKCEKRFEDFSNLST